MISAAALQNQLTDVGVNFWTGVPCSIFKELIRHLEAAPDIGYIAATREDTAIALASGAWLAGKLPLVLMQNSGLGVGLNTLVSLPNIYKIPMILLISWRGYEGRDAPEHLVMGKVMQEILKQIEVETFVLEEHNYASLLPKATLCAQERSMPVALLIKEKLAP